jgi:hypothetical protein
MRTREEEEWKYTPGEGALRRCALRAEVRGVIPRE